MVAATVTKGDSAAPGAYLMEDAPKTLDGCIRVRNI